MTDRWVENDMKLEKYITGSPENEACRAICRMMEGFHVGISYADMIRLRLGGSVAGECYDAYYVAHENGNGIARHWNGWGKHADAIGNWGNFYTDEAWRGRGIGGQLLALWWEDHQASDDRPLCFLCTAATKELTDLYRRFGFRPALEGADHGPLYMPIGESPSTFRAFCEAYYQPSETLIHRRAAVGYRHEIDCLLRFAHMDMGLSFGIGEIPSMEHALLYQPERAGMLFSEDGHVVGWSIDGAMQLHPRYATSRIVTL